MAWAGAVAGELLGGPGPCGRACEHLCYARGELVLQARAEAEGEGGCAM
jgi:hypothetical protein